MSKFTSFLTFFLALLVSSTAMTAMTGLPRGTNVALSDEEDISSDIALLELIEPLFAQLKNCNKDSETNDTKCTLAKKSLMSILEVNGIPSGTFLDFKARIENVTIIE